VTEPVGGIGDGTEMHNRLSHGLSISMLVIDQAASETAQLLMPVVHFRSIPYATIPARLRQSLLLNYIPDDFDDRGTNPPVGLPLPVGCGTCGHAAPYCVKSP
jgi:hypothetical protein